MGSLVVMHRHHSPLPAIVVSASAERFERAATTLALLGFRATHSPAVFVNSTAKCQGFNGHRFAMRKAWMAIVASNQSTAVFEDDVIPARTALRRAGNDTRVLARQIRKYIEDEQQRFDIVYLGGMGRLGSCKILGCFNTNVHIGDYWLWSTFYTDHAKWFSPRAARFLLACTNRCIELAGWATDSVVKHVCEHPPRYHRVGTEAQRQAARQTRDEHCPTAWRPEKLWCKPPEAEHSVGLARDHLGRLVPELEAGHSMRVGRENPYLLWLGWFWQDRDAVASTLEGLRPHEAHEVGVAGFVNGTLELGHACTASGRFGLCRRCTSLVRCEQACSWDGRCVTFAFAPGGLCGLYDQCEAAAPDPVLRFFNLTKASARVVMPRESGAKVPGRW